MGEGVVKLLGIAALTAGSRDDDGEPIDAAAARQCGVTRRELPYPEELGVGDLACPLDVAREADVSPLTGDRPEAAAGWCRHEFDPTSMTPARTGRILSPRSADTPSSSPRRPTAQTRRYATQVIAYSR